MCPSLLLLFFSDVLDTFETLLPGTLLIEMAISSLIPTSRFTCVILKRYIKVREFVGLPTNCSISFLFFCNTSEWSVPLRFAVNAYWKAKLSGCLKIFE